MLLSKDAERLSLVLRSSDPSANAAEVAAKNDKVGLVRIESLDVDVEDDGLLPAPRSKASVSNDQENMVSTRVRKCWKLKQGWRARMLSAESRSCCCTSVDWGSRATSWVVTDGGPSPEELDKNNEMGGNIVDRGRSPSGGSTTLVSSLSLTGEAIKCDNQMEDTSSSETASEEPEFPTASRVRSTGNIVGFWVTAVELNRATWVSRVTTRL